MNRLYAFLIAAALCPPTASSAWWQSIQQVAVSSGGTPMVTPLLSFASVYNFPNSATEYHGLFSSNFYSATSTAREFPVAISGSISALTVNFVSTVSPGTFAITLTKNGSPTSITCTVSATACTDSTHSVSVVAGDTVGYSSTPTSTPSASPAYISTLLTSSNPGQGYLGTGGLLTNPSNAAASYSGFFDSTGWNATELLVSNLVPTGGTLSNLYVLTSAAQGAAKTWVVSIFKNGVNSGVTCTMTNATTCSDLTDSISVAAGDLISIESCPGTVAAGLCTAVGSPTTGILRVGIEWAPTIAGESLAFTNVVGAPTASGTRFSFFNVSQLNGATESNTFNIAPVGMHVTKLNAQLSTAPGAAQSRTLTLRNGTGGGQSNTALTCAISGASQTTCSDIVDSVSIATNSFLNWQNVATATNTASTYLKLGAVVTSP